MTLPVAAASLIIRSARVSIPEYLAGRRAVSAEIARLPWTPVSSPSRIYARNRGAGTSNLPGRTVVLHPRRVVGIKADHAELRKIRIADELQSGESMRRTVAVLFCVLVARAGGVFGAPPSQVEPAEALGLSRRMTLSG